MTRIRICLFLICSMLSFQLAAFPTGNKILLTQNVSLKKVSQLDSQAIQSDVAILKDVFENSYGGKGILPRNQYLFLIESLNQIQQSPTTSWTSDSFCEALSSITEKIDDFHLTVHVEERTCGRIWPKAQVGQNIAQGSPNPTWSLISKSFRGNSVDILAIKKMTSAFSLDWNGFFLPSIA